MIQITPIDDLQHGDEIEIVLVDGRSIRGTFWGTHCPQPGKMFVGVRYQAMGQQLDSWQTTRIIETIGRPQMEQA